VTAPVESNTLNVNVFTAPGKTMVGERPKPFGEALGFDPITSTLIFGEHDAALVDAMLTVAEAAALADWVALHNRNLETIYITHAHFDHFYGLGILLDRFPRARAIATPKTVNEMQTYLSPPVERLARRMFPSSRATPIARIRHRCTFHRSASSSLATWCTTNATCTSATPRPRAGRIGSRRSTGWPR
jgi:glyoxylase-like metal-dependent hydrolase (beta-lactamase superfamily II)